MPLTREAYTRYRLIDERLRRLPEPRLDELVDYVCEYLDRPLSSRSIQRDIQDMRYNQSLKLEAPIFFDRKTHTYRYTDSDYSIHHLPVTSDDLHGLEFAISILDQFKQLPAIHEFEEAIKKIAETVRFNKQSRGEQRIIQFDRPNSYRGIEYIEPVVKAIREQRRIRLQYQKFDDEAVKEHIVEPYLVREFKSRFYLLGNTASGKQHKVKTFAFDRFVELQVTDTTFEGSPFDSEKYFENVYGITEGTGKAESVLLTFAPMQGKYVKSQPLHHSQRIVKETDTAYSVSLEVLPNTELVMQLLSYGANVKVLKPASLAKSLRAELKKAADQYK